MALIKVIELLAESKKSWEDAAQNAVDEASKSVRCIRSVYIKDFNAEVDEKGKITHWRLNCKISFEIDGDK
jgi:flavin-binding protein dodecin